MKHVDKKFLGTTAIGLSAWLIVIAMVTLGNTTTAMLTNEQTQPARDEHQPTTLSTTPEPSASNQPTTLRTTSETAMPDQGEVQSATITQAPASNVAQAAQQDISSELEAAKPSSNKSFVPILLAVVASSLLLAGAALWIVSSRNKQTDDQ